MVIKLNKNYDVSRLDWDSNYFGIESARVNLRGIATMEEQNEIIKLCEKYKFIAIVNFDNVVENNVWIGKKTDSFLVDINVQFSKKVHKTNKNNNKICYVTNNLKRDQNIIEIAKNSFVYSRFFLDKNLPIAKSKNIYAYWTEGAFEKQDKYFVLYSDNTVVKGYICFTIQDNFITIQLIAGDKKYQGQSIGKSLINEMEYFVMKMGINDIRVGTQANNVSAIQFYNSIGFKQIECNVVYHYWIK